MEQRQLGLDRFNIVLLEFIGVVNIHRFVNSEQSLPPLDMFVQLVSLELHSLEVVHIRHCVNCVDGGSEVGGTLLSELL